MRSCIVFGFENRTQKNLGLLSLTALALFFSSPSGYAMDHPQTQDTLMDFPLIKTTLLILGDVHKFVTAAKSGNIKVQDGCMSLCYNDIHSNPLIPKSLNFYLGNIVI